VDKKYDLEFHFGKGMALVPLVVVVIFAIYFFVIKGVYDMYGLAIGGVVALIIGCCFSKKISTFWEAAIHGMSGDIANTLTLILLIVSVFGKMMTKGQVAQGFIWLGDSVLNVGGSTMCVFAFVIAAIIATSTGSSIGTLLTLIPALLPAGAAFGADVPTFLGAVMSGALFGDMIGPVSDVTLVASQTQEYKNREGLPNIIDTVKSRFKYVGVAFVPALLLYIVIGGNGTQAQFDNSVVAQYSNPKGLFMLIPMAVLLFVAFKTASIFTAAMAGVFTGSIVGLITGLFEFSDIVGAKNGEISGFVVEGITNIAGTVIFIYMLTAMVGVLQDSGMMDAIINKLSHLSITKSATGSEFIIALGVSITGLMIGSANGPACLMFSPVANELGQEANIHPYRRANLLSIFASTIPLLNPFSSMFIMIVVGAANDVAKQFPFINSVSPMQIPTHVYFLIILICVMIFSIATGWGREYEGENGEVIKHKDYVKMEKAAYGFEK
jgi:Na+/H+ antiporter NhaC